MNIFTVIGILGLFILAYSILGEKFEEHKVSELQGIWETKGEIDDNGVILAPDSSHSVKNLYVSVSILAEKANKTIDVKATANWDIYKGNVFVRTISMIFEEFDIKIQKLSRNTWRYVSPNSENKITLSLKSVNVAKVLEEGRLTFSNVILPYKANYSLHKQQWQNA